MDDESGLYSWVHWHTCKSKAEELVTRKQGRTVGAIRGMEGTQLTVNFPELTYNHFIYNQKHVCT